MSEIEITWCAIPEHTGLESQLQAAERRAEEAVQDADDLERDVRAIEQQRDEQTVRAEEAEAALEGLLSYTRDIADENDTRVSQAYAVLAKAGTFLTASRPSTTEEEET